MSSTFQRLLIPVGGTDREFLAQEHAMQLAEDLELPLCAIHVTLRPEDVPSDLFSFVTALGKSHAVPVETRVLTGSDVGIEIVAEARPSDVVVIGTRRLNAKYHVSSVTHNIIQHAECPVHVVRLDA